MNSRRSTPPPRGSTIKVGSTNSINPLTISADCTSLRHLDRCRRSSGNCREIRYNKYSGSILIPHSALSPPIVIVGPTSNHIAVIADSICSCWFKKISCAKRCDDICCCIPVKSLCTTTAVPGQANNMVSIRGHPPSATSFRIAVESKTSQQLIFGSVDVINRRFTFRRVGIVGGACHPCSISSDSSLSSHTVSRRNCVGDSNDSSLLRPIPIRLRVCSHDNLTVITGIFGV